MSRMIDIREARVNLSRLLKQVAAGGEVVIAKAGKPVARLVPMGVQAAPKKLDLLKGQIKVPDDFNAPLDSKIQSLFEGS